jgi:hypothetical protein
MQRGEYMNGLEFQPDLTMFDTPPCEQSCVKGAAKLADRKVTAG